MRCLSFKHAGMAALGMADIEDVSVRRRRRVAAACGLAVVALVAMTKNEIVAAVATGRRSTAFASDLGDAIETGSGSRLQLFKRTSCVTNPQKDGWWLQTRLGLEQTAAEYWRNGTQYGSQARVAGGMYVTPCDTLDAACCSERAAMEALSASITFHQYKSWVSDAGPKEPEMWIDYFNSLHGTFAGGGRDQPWDWDAFAFALTTFYTPDLSTHVTRLDALRQPYLARSYVNPHDGTTVYALFLSDPHSGQMYQIEGGLVDDASPFAAMDASSCPNALASPFSTALADSWWRALNGTRNNSQGFPDLLATRVSLPASSLDEPKAYWKALDFAPARWAETTWEADNCATYASTFQGVRVGDTQTYAVVQYVHAPDARVGTFSLEDYEAYVDGQLSAGMGRNEGWSRYNDNHVGIDLGQWGYLDDLKPAFDGFSPHYRAHTVPQGYVPNDGSMYTKSPSAVAIEWHGVFNYSEFAADLGSFNFCSEDTTCARGVPLCSGSVAGVPSVHQEGDGPFPTT